MLNKDVFETMENILLNNDKPSIEINKLIKTNKLKNTTFDFLEKLSKIDQNPKYHPEGNVLNHVLLVVDEAAKVKSKSKDKRSLMFAALFHDIGKLTTTKVRKGRITSYNHDLVGEDLVFKILGEISDYKFKKDVSKLVKYHMQPLYFDKNLPFFNLEGILNETDYNEVALLSKCDRLGRGNLTDDMKNIEEIKINKFVEYCKSNT